MRLLAFQGPLAYWGKRLLAFQGSSRLPNMRLPGNNGGPGYLVSSYPELTLGTAYRVWMEETSS